MSCEACNCIIGESYSLKNGKCSNCGHLDNVGMVGTYIGMSDNVHMFQVSFRCPECNSYVDRYSVPCNDRNGIDVTEEFNIMFHRKESHWVGKNSDA